MLIGLALGPESPQPGTLELNGRGDISVAILANVQIASSSYAAPAPDNQSNLSKAVFNLLERSGQVPASNPH
jgi:hypothetical protein